MACGMSPGRLLEPPAVANGAATAAPGVSRFAARTGLEAAATLPVRCIQDSGCQLCGAAFDACWDPWVLAKHRVPGHQLMLQTLPRLLQRRQISVSSRGCATWQYGSCALVCLWSQADAEAARTFTRQHMGNSCVSHALLRHVGSRNASLPLQLAGQWCRQRLVFGRGQRRGRRKFRGRCGGHGHRCAGRQHRACAPAASAASGRRRRIPAGTAQGSSMTCLSCP